MAGLRFCGSPCLESSFFVRRRISRWSVMVIPGATPKAPTPSRPIGKRQWTADLTATWLTGNGGFGYADNSSEVALVQTPLADMLNRYTHRLHEAHLRGRLGGGLRRCTWCSRWIGMTGSSRGWTGSTWPAPTLPERRRNRSHTATATGSHESSRGNSSPNSPTSYDLGPVGSRLPIGTHILAIIGLNQTAGSS